MRPNVGSFVALVLASVACGGATAAESLVGTKHVTLANARGDQVQIGSVKFEPAGEGRWRFDFRLDESRFGEYFLAMRPFRCLAGATQNLCHFPYGEERLISREDLAPLEYQLMFMRKKPAEVSVNPTNGVYYKLAWSEKGLRGELFDVDMDPIIVPEGDMRRPIRTEHLHAADPGSHWLPLLRIE
jgi:hypothetical protein